MSVAKKAKRHNWRSF